MTDTKDVLFETKQTGLNQTVLDVPRLLSGHYWAELRVFLAVSKAGSFNKAADILNSSQPTVSRQVQRLQDVIGVQLLIPTKTGVRLTLKGELLARTLAHFDLLLSAVSDDLKGDMAQAEGQVRVAATEGLAGFFIAPNLRQISQMYPKIQVTIQSPVNMSSLRENLTDMMIGFMPETASDVLFRRLGTVHLIPVVARTYIEQFGMPTRSSISKHLFIQSSLYSGDTGIWDPWTQAVAKGRIAHCADNSFTYGMLVKTGLGIGLLGNYTLLEPNAVPLDLDIHIPVPLYAAVLKDRLDSKPARIIFDFLCEVFSDTNPWFSPKLRIDPKPTPYDAGFRALFNIETED